jgi:hypothetical protein
MMYSMSEEMGISDDSVVGQYAFWMEDKSMK